MAMQLVWSLVERPHFVLNGKNPIPVKLPWIFPGAPLKINGAPGNIQGNLTGMISIKSDKCPSKIPSNLWWIQMDNIDMININGFVDSL